MFKLITKWAFLCCNLIAGLLIILSIQWGDVGHCIAVIEIQINGTDSAHYVCQQQQTSTELLFPRQVQYTWTLIQIVFTQRELLYINTYVKVNIKQSHCSTENSAPNGRI